MSNVCKECGAQDGYPHYRPCHKYDPEQVFYPKLERGDDECLNRRRFEFLLDEIGAGARERAKKAGLL